MTGLLSTSSTAFDRERLDALVAEGWLRTQRHPEADLWIYNYTERTQYENYWTPETLACRGLILDAEGGIVARPFAKFFNWGTPQAADLPLHEPHTITEKFDGSLGILYGLDGEARIATRGSFVSEQAHEATRMLEDYDYEIDPDTTPLFEIIYPTNRIVVDYGDRRELVLLAVLDNATGRDSTMKWSGPETPRVVDADLDDLGRLQEYAKPNAEGFVVAFESGARVKVKFEEYVRLHKIVTGVNARMIWDSLRNDDDLDELLTDVPDEIYQWIANVRDHLRQTFDDEQRKAAEVFVGRPQDVDRKALAQYFTGSTANPAVLFRMLDGKPYDDLIWKSIKPGPESPRDVGLEAA